MTLKASILPAEEETVTPPTVRENLVAIEGNPRTLISNPGSAPTGSHLEYAVTTTTDEEPAEGWTSNVDDITGTDPGTYYVWYRVVDDSTGDVVGDPAYITVTMSEAGSQPSQGGGTAGDLSVDGSISVSGLSSGDKVNFYRVLEFDPDATSTGGWVAANVIKIRSATLLDTHQLKAYKASKVLNLLTLLVKVPVFQL